MRINNPYSLLILTCIINNLGYSMLCISNCCYYEDRVTLTNPSSTLTLTFNSAFSSMPQYAFGKMFIMQLYKIYHSSKRESPFKIK